MARAWRGHRGAPCHCQWVLVHVCLLSGSPRLPDEFCSYQTSRGNRIFPPCPRMSVQIRSRKRRPDGSVGGGLAVPPQNTANNKKACGGGRRRRRRRRPATRPAPQAPAKKRETCDGAAAAAAAAGGDGGVCPHACCEFPAWRGVRWAGLSSVCLPVYSIGGQGNMQNSAIVPRCKSRDGRTEFWRDEGIYGWMDGWMDGWVDGWMDQWINGWMDVWSICGFQRVQIPQ
eukprot:gene9835-biopygen19758